MKLLFKISVFFFILIISSISFECAAKIKSFGAVDVKVINDSLEINIANVKGKKKYKGCDLVCYIFINDKKICCQFINLENKKKYDIKTVKFQIPMDIIKGEEVYDELSEKHIRKKRSFWNPSNGCNVNVVVKLNDYDINGSRPDYYIGESFYFYDLENAVTVYEGSITIPQKETKMSIGGVRTHVKEGEVFINFDDVLIENPDFKDFDISVWFYDETWNQLKDSDGSFCTTDGHVATSFRYTELYDTSIIPKILTSRMSIKQLHLPMAQRLRGANLKIEASIIDKTTRKHLHPYLKTDLIIPPAIANINNIWVAGDNTSVFHLEDLKIKNLYGEKLKCVLSFYDSDKRPLIDTNNSYYLKGGFIGKEFDLDKIDTDDYEIQDYKLEFPVSEFHLNRDIDNHLFCKVNIQNDEGVSLFSSNYFPFEIKAKEKPKATKVENNTSSSSSSKKTSNNVSSSNPSVKNNSTKTESNHVHQPRQVWKERWNPCMACDPNRPGRCRQCNGQGGFYIGNFYNVCGSCSGTGACYLCGGRGQILETYSVWE